MDTQQPIDDDTVIVATFGRRKVAPRACVADSKPHIRNFIREALEELGFIACDCAPADDLARGGVASSARTWWCSACRPAASPPTACSTRWRRRTTAAKCWCSGRPPRPW